MNMNINTIHIQVHADEQHTLAWERKGKGLSPYLHTRMLLWIAAEHKVLCQVKT